MFNLLGSILPIGCRGNGTLPISNVPKAFASGISDSMCFSTGNYVKRNRVPLPATPAYGTFHTLRATGQCGTHSEGIFHIVAIVIDIAVVAVHKRRIVIIVAG
jgi:hypothetical protein